MKRLEIKGINFAEVTLHVGLGTFNPIEVEDLSKHKMESEEIIIDEKNAAIINKAVESHRRVCAVGTTTMRALETSVSSNKNLCFQRMDKQIHLSSSRFWCSELNDHELPHTEVYSDHDDCCICRKRFRNARL